MKMVHALGQKWDAEYQHLPKEEQDAVLESMASPQGLCARQRFGGHNENTGYATSLRRAIGSLRVRNSPGESRFALCHRESPVKLICTQPIGERWASSASSKAPPDDRRCWAALSL